MIVASLFEYDETLKVTFISIEVDDFIWTGMANEAKVLKEDEKLYIDAVVKLYKKEKKNEI